MNHVKFGTGLDHKHIYKFFKNRFYMFRITNVMKV
jgi:hypothetical protein